MKVYLTPKHPGALLRRKKTLVPGMIEFDPSSSDDDLYKDCLRVGAEYAGSRAAVAEFQVDEIDSIKGLPNLYDYIKAEDSADYWQDRAVASRRVSGWLSRLSVDGKVIEVVGPAQAPHVYTSIMHGIGVVAAGDEKLIDRLCGPGRIEYLVMPPEPPYVLPDFMRGV